MGSKWAMCSVRTCTAEEKFNTHTKLKPTIMKVMMYSFCKTAVVRRRSFKRMYSAVLHTAFY